MAADERPLRPAQLMYAAADAAVLLRLHAAVAGAAPSAAAALRAHVVDVSVPTGCG